jgi:hypothetical protein
MYSKGKAFSGAAVLLRHHPLQNHPICEHVDYVVLHFLCQGIEIILKGLLLIRDFDKYDPRLTRFGHNLLEIATEAATAYHLNPARNVLAEELSTLSKFYSKHQLRYGGLGDIFIDPRTIPRDAIFRRVAAIIRLAEKSLKRSDAEGRRS